jgi:hypothetical protein
MNAGGTVEARFDLVMTALAVCAADGNAAACLVMSHILRKIPGAGKTEARIATSWLVRAFDKVLFHRADAASTKIWRAAAPLGCTAVARPDSRTLSPWDPTLFHHTAILWARLRGVLAAGRPDGGPTTTFG